MNHTRRRTPLADPTAEGTADQSTQENSGLHGSLDDVRAGAGPERSGNENTDDVLNRSAEERYETPRRYDDDHHDPAMPSDDSALNTRS